MGQRNAEERVWSVMSPGRWWSVLAVCCLVVAGLFWVAFRDTGGGSAHDSADGSGTDSASVSAAPASSSPGRAFGLPATTSDRAAHSRKARTSQSFRIASDGSFEVPVDYRFAGVRRVQTAGNFEDWLAKYAPSDQALIRTFNTRNHGVYDIASAQTVAWMAAHGYPMPEDLIAAQTMSIEQLRRKVKDGSIKAAFLLKNRVSVLLAKERAAYTAAGKPGYTDGMVRRRRTS